MNDFDDLDELERDLGPSLRIALRRDAGTITAERPPEARWLSPFDEAPSDLYIPEPGAEGAPDLDDYVSSERRLRRRRWLLAAAAVVVVLLAGGALVQIAGDDDVAPVSPRPTPSTETTSLSPDPRTAFPRGGAATVPGVLLDPQPDLPVFVYEDRRVIWPDWRPALEPGGTATTAQSAGSWRDWFERRLTPEGLELVRAEIRRGGRLDPDRGQARCCGPGQYAYWDGERQIVHGTPWPDLSWLPDRAWADPDPRVFVPSGYQVCLSVDHTNRSGLLPQLPDTAAEWLVGARQSAPPVLDPRATCFDLATDDARQLSIALYTAEGTAHTYLASPYSYAITTPGAPPIEASGYPPYTMYISFSPYLPHGNAVISYIG